MLQSQRSPEERKTHMSLLKPDIVCHHAITFPALGSFLTQRILKAKAVEWEVEEKRTTYKQVQTEVVAAASSQVKGKLVFYSGVYLRAKARNTRGSCEVSFSYA